MKIIEFIIIILGWLQIVASPLLMGSIIGFIIYISRKDWLGFVIAMLFTFSGLAVGIVWATKISKKEEPISFVLRIRATPDLDYPENEINKKKIRLKK